MDEHGGDAGQAVRLAEQHSLLEPGRVGVVVGANARERKLRRVRSGAVRARHALTPTSIQRSIPRCSRSRSMSWSGCWVVFTLKSTARSLACGRLPPAAALIEEDDAVALGVELAALARPAAGSRPSWTTSAGLPSGFAQVSQ
jgi:hypothetical protein